MNNIYYNILYRNYSCNHIFCCFNLRLRVIKVWKQDRHTGETSFRPRLALLSKLLVTDYFRNLDQFGVWWWQSTEYHHQVSAVYLMFLYSACWVCFLRGKNGTTHRHIQMRKHPKWNDEGIIYTGGTNFKDSTRETSTDHCLFCVKDGGIAWSLISVSLGGFTVKQLRLTLYMSKLSVIT